jgi:hypothetical protein
MVSEDIHTLDLPRVPRKEIPLLMFRKDSIGKREKR